MYYECRPFGAHKCGSLINPGLAPWAMQECRPKGLFADEPNRLFVTSCWIYWGDVVVSFVVGFIGQCRWLHLLLDLLGNAGVSAFRHDTPAKPRVE